MQGKWRMKIVPWWFHFVRLPSHNRQIYELFIFCQQSHKRSDSTYIFFSIIKFPTNILALFLTCPTCVKLPSVIFISIIKVFYWKMDSPSLHNVNNRKVMPQYNHLVWQSFPQINEKCQGGPFLFVHISVYCLLNMPQKIYFNVP